MTAPKDIRLRLTPKSEHTRVPSNTLPQRKEHRMTSIRRSLTMRAAFLPTSILAGLLFGGVARADALIDNFNQKTASYPISRTSVGVTMATDSPLLTSNTIGGVREVTLIGDNFPTPPDSLVTF